MRILVVEDEFWIRKRICTHLEEKFAGTHTEIIQAESSWETERVIVDNPPDVILLDVTIRGATGLDVLEKVGGLSGCHVILITGNRSFETVQRALRLGADDYLTKPIDFMALDDAIARAATVVSTEDLLNRFLRQATISHEVPSEADTTVEQVKRAFFGATPLSAAFLALPAIPKGASKRLHSSLVSTVRETVGHVPSVFEIRLDAQHGILSIVSTLDSDHMKQLTKRGLPLGHYEWWGAVAGDLETPLELARAARRAYWSLMFAWYAPAERFIDVHQAALSIRDATSLVEASLDLERLASFRSHSEAETDSLRQTVSNRLFANRVPPDMVRQFGLSVVKQVENLHNDVRFRVHDYSGRIIDASSFGVLFGVLVEIAGTYAEALKKENSEATVLSVLVQRAVQIVAMNMKNPALSASRVAAELGVSRSHFSTVFSREMGVPFTLYLQRTRIEHAIWLMHLKPDLPIKYVAGEAGFRDVFYFSRVFKKITGRPPTMERDSVRSVSD